jgi:hypothetical protein
MISRIIKAIANVIRAQKNGEIRRHQRGVPWRLNVFCMRISSNDGLEDDIR